MSTAPARPTDHPGCGPVLHPGLVAGLVERAGSSDYDRWLGHVRAAAGCSHPIRLRGDLHTVEPATGRIVTSASTDGMPDGVLYVPCGNRRATVCPSCAETYRADTFHLVRAGLAGGKGVPPTVAEHPCVFLTGTAPSFGAVHTHHRDGRPCRPRRDAPTCPHGVVQECRARHADDDRALGRPLCLDCYDHAHQVVWNAWAGELWRRSMNTANRHLRALADRHAGGRLRLSYAKVAEFQRRGVAHVHAMVRLDAVDPDDPDAIVAPPASITSAHLAVLLRDALAATSFTTPPHPTNPAGWPIAWGAQLDPRQVRLTVRDVDDTGHITTGAVAGYLAKYATKATEITGHASARLTDDTIALHTDPRTHAGRLVAACWHLGQAPTDVLIAHREWERRHAAEEGGDPLAEWMASYGRLRRWAHMLGFGGHFSTKSRRYSTTLGALREARRAWRRAQLDEHRPADERADDDSAGEETTVVIGALAFAGIGWHTTADALLANTAAANAREHRLTAREELTTNPVI
ncbi:replication initiator [Pseudonocardia nigra]|uniref:replication initiator n=1 Tax=Pseudonocardia nigra TaxID=1921578 RepID=UPI001FE3772E|nr:replication initiator [Pseudonocardia nigra]